MRIFRICPKRSVRLPGNPEAGVSLVSVMVASGILMFIALAISAMMGQASKTQVRLENNSELSYVQTAIRDSLSDPDCDITLQKALDKYQIDPSLPFLNKMQILCNANGPSGSGLLQSKPITLYRKGLAGNVIPVTSALDSGKDYSGRLGIWWVRVGCDLSKSSFVVHAARFVDGGGKSFRKDPISGKSLDWNNESTVLFAGSQLAPPLCTKAISGQSAPQGNTGLSSFKSYFMDKSGEVNFEVPKGAVFSEILVDGQWQGNGDSGEDFYTAKILVDHKRKEYTGTQVVKIGSGANRAQTIHWKPTPIGTAPKLEGLENMPQKLVKKNGKKTAAAKFFDRKFPKPLLDSLETNTDGSKKLKFSEKNVDDSRKQTNYWNSGVMIKHYGGE